MNAYHRLRIILFAVLLSGSPLWEGSAGAQEPLLIEAQEIIHQAVGTYDRLDSYQASLERQYSGEDVKPEEIFLRFEKPLVVYMHWLNGSQRGLQVVYSNRHFDDKILSRPPGFLFQFIPIVHLAKDDPRVMKAESHSIEKAGIGYILNDFAQDFADARASNQVKVLSVEDVEIDGEKAKRITVLFNVPMRNYPKVSMAFSEEHHLPIEIKLYRSLENSPEVYRYLNLSINPPRDNEAFQKSIDRRLFNSYQKI